MSTHATTKVQLSTGEVLETLPMVHIDALHERNRVEEVMSKPTLDPTVRFPHRNGDRTQYRVLAAAHIVQTWTETVTVLPASTPDAEA